MPVESQYQETKAHTNIPNKEFLPTVDGNKADFADSNKQSLFSGCPHHTPRSEALMLTPV